MPLPQIRIEPTEADVPSAAVVALRARFAAVRAELELDAPYPADAVAEAERVAAGPPDPPTRDLTDLPFWTLDPASSMDLDQAMHLERDGAGHRIRYAIADVPAFVMPGGALDAATRARAQTVYCPDERVPLHPAVLSEGAASLLPGQARPAYVWDLRLDGDGAVTSVHVERAMVRSRDRQDYDTVQAQVDAGTSDERFVLLREIGERRLTQERARGGASLPIPEQQVRITDDGGFALEFRPPVAAEDWNAQISLATGMSAARLMLDAGIGLLRTMPPPREGSLDWYRRQAKALGAPWPPGTAYGEFIRMLDRTDPRHLALLHAAAGLFRGAGYTPFDGAVPAEPTHAAVAAPYAHVTAPLRRLVDRFGLVLCAHICAGQDPPPWVRSALAGLPQLMAEGGRAAAAAERACSDAAEAGVLTGRVGGTLDAVILERAPKAVIVQLLDLPIVERARGGGRVGRAVSVRVDSADIAAGAVELSVVPAPAPTASG